MFKDERIRSIRAFIISPSADEGDPPLEDDPEAAGMTEEVFNWRRQKVANPMTKYPEFRDSRSASMGKYLSALIVVVAESEGGHIGIGTTSGGIAAAAIVEFQLARMVEGDSVFAHERHWDRMYNSTVAQGRKGTALHAISAVDIALWDLHGKVTQTPVYALLGGPVSASVDVYGTGPSPSKIHDLGFWGAKLPLTWGPSEGVDGFRRNVERAAAAREATSADFPLLYDCWMALDVDYAIRLSWALDDLGFRWIEEPLMPDDYAGHAELRRRMPPRMQLTAGEHEYTARGHDLLAKSGVDILQPDPAWCGGITEMRRIAAVASINGKRLIPHVGGQYSYHFLAAQPDAFMAEFPVMQGLGDRIVPQHESLFTGEALPVDGKITVGDAPGFGLELKESVKLHRPFPPEWESLPRG
ncbi:MAG: L-rhamnonate dehydratase [Salinibacterium sp.]|nr:L-rhamnonate dehydratase [Salinibacterium sp.]